MTKIRPLVAGNWKMNGLRASLDEAAALRARLAERTDWPVDVMICPPATLLAVLAADSEGSALLLGGQDCHPAMAGAHTGDLSAEMLADAGAAAVIVGHSERRADHGETSALVREKATAVHRAGLCAIVCVGETESERRTGETLAVVGRQLAGSIPEDSTAFDTVIAYEPVWAIGTGLTPTTEDVAEVHAMTRARLDALLGPEHAAAMRILYGGSVKPGNAAELMRVENVDGALVGGASLKASDFLGIVAAYA